MTYECPKCGGDISDEAIASDMTLTCSGCGVIWRVVLELVHDPELENED